MIVDENIERLRALARKLIYESVEQYGTPEDQVERLLPPLVDLGTNDDLFVRMEQLAGSTFLSERRTILEIGCGTGPFVLSALSRGHDAYGIDNDLKRLEVAWEKLSVYNLPAQWKERMQYGDAMRLAFPSNSFDVVLGWQVIEHVPSVQATLFECVRVAKKGGVLFFWAPDYRAPYEAHYAMPYPPFASPEIARAWVAAMGRPAPGIDTFFGITLPQIHSILEALGCRIFASGIDKTLDLGVARLIDTSTQTRLEASASAVRHGMATQSLPLLMTSPTSLTIAAIKL
jgi:2-polyprenyl-3-methyl-5-hydroxy-6-metoxy-1,4-benzoquinol methylase